MSRQNDISPDALELLERFCEGELDADAAERLEQLVCSDPAVCRMYIKYVDLHVELSKRFRLDEPEQEYHELSATSLSETSIPSLSPLPSPLSPSFVGGPVFSYMVATVVLCLMLLGAWAYKISHDRDLHIVENSRTSTPTGPEELVFVGRITGMKDCRWSNQDTQTVIGALVPLGREYALASGLLKITYKSGAQVIIEGPCSYKVDSETGGYLQRGKVVARIDNKAMCKRVWLERKSSAASTHTASAGGSEQFVLAICSSNNGDDASRNQPCGQLRVLRGPTPVFCVRTPSAVVTDLGTEFGVEVAENGATTSHVFQGIVEFKSLAGGKTVRLTQNQSARVVPDGEKIISLSREKSRPESYARNMRPRRTVAVFSTGRGLSGGQLDPHWMLAASGDSPIPDSRPAVVVADLPRAFSRGNSGHSQWISSGQTDRDGPCTFHTQFDLVGVSPSSTVLWGRIMANGWITAMRLNGRPITTSDLPARNLTTSFGDFTVSEGFVAGRNRLEIDLAPVDSPAGPMLRVELEGKSEVFCPTYKFVDLSLERRDCKATCISDNRLVSGYMKIGYRKFPLIYDGAASNGRNPRARRIPMQRDVSATVRACNNAGQLVGCTFIGDDESAAAACVLSENDGLVRLPGSDEYKTSEAWAISESGVIVGDYTTHGNTVHSFVYTGDGDMTNIAGLGGNASRARGVNELGWIVGFATLSGDDKEHAYLYDGKKTIDLGKGNGVSSRALGLNNSGSVVGYVSDSSNRNHAHAYRCEVRGDERPVLHRLESLGAYSIAYDVNESGTVIGQYWDGNASLDNFRAFVYLNGKMYDLNQLVSLPHGHTLRMARGINNSGMIAAWGTTWGGREFACLLTPVENAEQPIYKTVSTE